VQYSTPIIDATPPPPLLEALCSRPTGHLPRGLYVRSTAALFLCSRAAPPPVPNHDDDRGDQCETRSDHDGDQTHRREGPQKPGEGVVPLDGDALPVDRHDERDGNRGRQATIAQHVHDGRQPGAVLHGFSHFLCDGIGGSAVVAAKCAKLVQNSAPNCKRKTESF